MAPVVDIVEIGNGGGSIAWIDEGGSLKVGPRSAGALPGPVAYGKGGEDPTTTDANLIAGRLSAKNFDMEVSLDHVRAALLDKVGKAFGVDAEEAAESIIRVADSNMNNALKLISVRLGYDPISPWWLLAAAVPCTGPRSSQGIEHPQSDRSRSRLRVLRLGKVAVFQ